MARFFITQPNTLTITKPTAFFVMLTKETSHKQLTPSLSCWRRKHPTSNSHPVCHVDAGNITQATHT